MTACQHLDGARICGSNHNIRDYLSGRRCPQHTPAALAGRPDHTPDPERTLDGIRAAKGISYGYRTTDTALNDDRAIATGRRRSTPKQYAAARAAEQKRKTRR